MFLRVLPGAEAAQDGVHVAEALGGDGAGLGHGLRGADDLQADGAVVGGVGQRPEIAEQVDVAVAPVVQLDVIAVRAERIAHGLLVADKDLADEIMSEG